MRTITALVTMTATLLACDLDDQDLPGDAQFADIPDDIDAALELAVEDPPEAAYDDCPAWANFCFWTGAWYEGVMTPLSGGDFAINFVAPDGKPRPVYSMRKRSGTYRVKVFSGFNMTGSCKVIGPDGGAALEPVLPFAALSAKRIEPTAKGC